MILQALRRATNSYTVKHITVQLKHLYGSNQNKQKQKMLTDVTLTVT